jgi:hypothetical protein
MLCPLAVPRHNGKEIQMRKNLIPCVAVALLLGGCGQTAQPLQPSAAVPQTSSQLNQQPSSHKFDGQTAHVQLNTQVNGTTVAAAFFGNHVKDLSTVSGNNKFDFGIIGIFQQETANPDHVLMQAFAFVDNLQGFTVNGNSKSATLNTTVPVFNDADGTTVPVTLALEFQATGEVLNDTSSREKFRFGDFTFLTAFKQLTTIASVRGTASWAAGGVSTTVNVPLANGDTFATLDSTVSVDRFSSK